MTMTTSEQIKTVKLYSEIEALLKVVGVEDGLEYHYSLDNGQKWSCLLVKGFHPVSGVLNYEWEACVTSRDAYSSTTAQTWYSSIEEMMEANRV